MKNILRHCVVWLIGCGLFGCAGNSRTKQTKVTAKFVVPDRVFKKINIWRLGISLELPKNVKDVDVYTERDDFSLLKFRVMELTPAAMFIESGPLIWGEVYVYDAKQELVYQNDEFNSIGYKAYVGTDNRRITACDKIVKLDTPLRNRFGYVQKLYRLDHKDMASGKAFRATICRASYAKSPSIDRSDEDLIARILYSIKFE